MERDTKLDGRAGDWVWFKKKPPSLPIRRGELKHKQAVSKTLNEREKNEKR